jgi:hypothetical protein
VRILVLGLALVAPIAWADIAIYQSGSRWATIEPEGDVYVSGNKVGSD